MLSTFRRTGSEDVNAVEMRVLDNLMADQSFVDFPAGDFS